MLAEPCKKMTHTKQLDGSRLQHKRPRLEFSHRSLCPVKYLFRQELMLLQVSNHLFTGAALLTGQNKCQVFFCRCKDGIIQYVWKEQSLSNRFITWQATEQLLCLMLHFSLTRHNLFRTIS